MTPEAAAAEPGFPLAVLPTAGSCRDLPADLLDLEPVLATEVRPLHGDVTSIEEVLARHSTSALLVLREGVRTVEWFADGFSPNDLHPLFSVTKSLTGTLAAVAVDEGRLDRSALVTDYLPELKGSGFQTATVGHVLDMTVDLTYDENYEDPGTRFFDYLVAIGAETATAGQATSIREYLPTLTSGGRHGWAFQYATPVAETAGWLVERAFDAPYVDVLAARLWNRLGSEQDAVIGLDPSGQPISGGGLATTIGDLARFGQMLCDGGAVGADQVVPSRVVDLMRSGGDTAVFARCQRYAHLTGYAYGNQWWLPANSGRALSAWGIHGQLLWVDPVARVVVAGFSDSPVADDPRLDDEYDALCRELVRLCGTP